MRLRAAIKHDLAFQFRHGFYYAYLVVSIVYIVFLRSLPEGIKDGAAVLILFSDPATLGFFFIGAIILLEKSQRVLDNMFVTPLQLSDYLLSKVVSLTILALVTSLAIKGFAFGFAFNPVPLIVGIVLSSVFFTLVGLTLAVKVQTLNGFLFSASIYTVVLFLPVVDFLGIYHTPLFYLFPSQASLVLIQAAFQSVGTFKVVYAVVAMFIWITVVYMWACRSFEKHVVLKIGGGIA